MDFILYFYGSFNRLKFVRGINKFLVSELRMKGALHTGDQLAMLLKLSEEECEILHV